MSSNSKRVSSTSSIPVVDSDLHLISQLVQDNLPKVHLTERALDELDRINNEATRHIRRRERRAINRQRARELEIRRRGQDLSSAGLKRYARGGGPDLCDIRQFCDLYSSTYTWESTSAYEMLRRIKGEETVNTAIKIYNGKFEQHLIDHHIYPNAYRDFGQPILPDPTNMHEIKQMLLSLQTSHVSFSEEEFGDFCCAYERSKTENEFSKIFLPILEGSLQRQMWTTRNIRFTKLDDLTDGTIQAAQPDLSYGAGANDLNPLMREKLSREIVPSDTGLPVIAPNFFGEIKGPMGTEATAKRQLLYDMALGERGQMALRNFGKVKPIYNGEAHTLGCTWVGSTLKIYAMYILPPTDSIQKPRYSLRLIEGWEMTGNISRFRQGVVAFRNATLWAKTQRDLAIAEANSSDPVANKDDRNQISEIFNIGDQDTDTASYSQDSVTSTDELAV